MVRPIKSAPMQSTRSANKTWQACRREKKKAAIDFLNLQPIPPGAFELATRKDQICLKHQHAEEHAAA